MPKSEHVRNHYIKEGTVAEPIKTGSDVCSRCFQGWYLHDTPDDGSEVPWESCLKALLHNLNYYKEQNRQNEQRVKDVRHEMWGRVSQAREDAHQESKRRPTL